MTLTRILSIEDDPDIREILRLSLETVGGLEVCICGSAGEAIEQAADFGPDMLLVDAMMPAVDGPSALVALRKVAGLASIPAVFLTARVAPSEVQYYYELGAVGVIAKPFDPMTLATQLRTLWKEAVHG